MGQGRSTIKILSMISKQYELATLEYHEESNILVYRVKQDIEIDVQELGVMLQYVEEFIGPKRHYAILDFGENLLTTSEARERYAQWPYGQKYRIADAFLVRSLSLRIVANFFINVTLPKIKTKLFTDEHAAMEWLQKQGEVINLVL